MSIVLIASWLAFILLGSLFLVLATLNALLWWQGIVHKQERVPSIAPVIGGMLGFIGLRLSPIPIVSDYAWLALVLDTGCIPYVLLTSAWLARERWRTRRANLLAEYQGQQGPKTVTLQLFCQNIYTLRYHLQRPPGQTGLVAYGWSGQAHWDGSRLNLQIGKDGGSAVLETVPGSQPETLRQVIGFPSWENSREWSLAHIDFIKSPG